MPLGFISLHVTERGVGDAVQKFVGEPKPSSPGGKGAERGDASPIEGIDAFCDIITDVNGDCKSNQATTSRR